MAVAKVHTKDIYIPMNDYGFNIAFTLYDGTGDVFDPTGYVVTLKVWTYDVPAVLLLTGVGGITSGVDGKVYYTIQSGDFTTEGTFMAEIELTKAGQVESFRNHVLHVTESG